MDLTLTTKEGKLNIRAAAVILHNGRILVEQAVNAPFAVCPGGRIKFGETAEAAIERELTEELGEKPDIVRPLYIHQNFFTMQGIRYHEICFFFSAEVSSNICAKTSVKNLNGSSQFVWVKLDELPNMSFYPEFLKRSAASLPDRLTVITEYEEDFDNGTV